MPEKNVSSEVRATGVASSVDPSEVVDGVVVVDTGVDAADEPEMAAVVADASDTAGDAVVGLIGVEAKATGLAPDSGANTEPTGGASVRTAQFWQPAILTKDQPSNCQPVAGSIPSSVATVVRISAWGV